MELSVPVTSHRKREVGTMRHGIVSSFLWMSGAERQILQACGRMESYETARMAAQGALVLIPAALGAGSMTYAVSTLTPNLAISSAIGITFGAIVFAIDRYIVMTVHKAQRGAKALLRRRDLSPNSTAGKPLRRRTGLIAAVARVAMTMLLSAVISDPIVLLVNAGSINRQLSADRSAGVAAIRKEAQTEKAALPSPVGLKAAEAQLGVAQALSQCLGTLLSDEQSGIRATLTCGSSSGVPTQGPIFRFDLARQSSVDSQINVLQAQVNTLNATLTRQQAAIDTQAASQIRQFERSFSYDYPARLHALQQLAQRDPEILVLEVVLFCLFMVIDLTALTLKLSTPAGVYEATLDKMTEEAVITVVVDTETRLQALQSPQVRQAQIASLATEMELDHLTDAVNTVAQTQVDTAETIRRHTSKTKDPTTVTSLRWLATNTAQAIGDITIRLFQPPTNNS